MTRALRRFGAALLWTVRAVAAAAVFAVGLPVTSVAALGRVLIRRGEMSGVDDLDDVLRAEIDGDGEAYAAHRLGCGCPRIGHPVAHCPACGWSTCLAHACGPHLCEPDPVIEAFNTNPRNTPVGEDFAAWEQECAGLSRLAKKLGGAR